MRKFSEIAVCTAFMIFFMYSTCYATDWCYEHVERGEYRKAIEVCTERIKMTRSKKNKALFYNNRCRAYNALGKYDKAIDDCTKAIELGPEYVHSYTNRANAYWYKGYYTLALNDCNRALEIDSEYHGAYVTKGNIFYRKGDYDSAIRNYTRAMEIEPDDGGAYYNMACVYSMLKNTDRACEYLRKAVSHGFNDWDLLKKDDDLNNIRNQQCFREIIKNH